ncbi:serine/threonine-protein kinase [Roseateles sp.]|uniref:serine/threonine-protein kinase n=1 Tax=Roseateles sp. TaxID=1971397 RepID=UPI0032652A90
MALQSVLSNDWPALSQLIDEALALSAPERDAWLQSLDGNRAAHRDTLCNLLATQAAIETGDFLADLPVLPTAASTAANVPSAAGHLVGAYRLIEPIGHGGMGTVWLTERADGTVKRRVALKLPHAVWGDAFTERLVREREILAALDHPNIARLYDAGVDAHGRPFLAMAYVAGQPIDAYCRDHGLPLRSRVELLLQVMAAVAHAHARLVVHRDLKPGNILVDDDDQVVLLDFGIAKLLDGEQTRETALTAMSGRALTLDYASPEQIRGEPLGTASDIYSLAVVAYELLAGGRPYRLTRGSAAELEEAIAGIEAPRASDTASDALLKRQLRGDLNAILNKALKKRPDERYLTMDAFAHDLRRYLADEPVEARPDGLSYRTTKFVRRYRLQVAAGALVVIALMGGTTVALWQAYEARLQTQRALAEAATAEAVQSFLEGVFLTNSGDQVDPIKARERTARELLDRGAQRIETELVNAPQARLRLLGVLASMYEKMGLVDRQIALRRQQLDEARRVSGRISDVTVTAMARLADALTTAEQRHDAASLLRDASVILDARNDHDSRTRFLVELLQASLDRRIDPKHGLAAARRALAIARRYPPDADLLLTLVVLGENALFIGEFEQARQSFAEFVHISQVHPPLGANDLSMIYGALAEAQRKLGDFAHAEANQRTGLEIARRRAEPLPIHYCEIQLSRLLVDTGRFRESVEAAEPAWHWSHTTEAEADPATVHWIKVNYAEMLMAYGRASEVLSVTAGDVSLTIDPQVAQGLDLRVLSFRARALTELDRLSDARAVLERSRALLAQSNGKLDSRSTDRAELQWLVASGEAAKALSSYRAARVAKQLPQTPPSTASVADLTESAWLELEAGHASEAYAQASQALAAIANGGAAAYQRHHEARATLVLGKALMLQQRVDEARPLLERAVTLHRAIYDPQHSSVLADAWRTLAACRKAQGDTRAAAEATREASRIDA